MNSFNLAVLFCIILAIIFGIFLVQNHYFYTLQENAELAFNTEIKNLSETDFNSLVSYEKEIPLKVTGAILKLNISVIKVNTEVKHVIVNSNVQYNDFNQKRLKDLSINSQYYKLADGNLALLQQSPQIVKSE